MREAKETSIRQAVAVSSSHFHPSRYLKYFMVVQVPRSLILTLPRHSPCPSPSLFVASLSHAHYPIPAGPLHKKIDTMKRAFLW
jgi:hypothetical protein